MRLKYDALIFQIVRIWRDLINSDIKNENGFDIIKFITLAKGFIILNNAVSISISIPCTSSVDEVT